MVYLTGNAISSKEFSTETEKLDMQALSSNSKAAKIRVKSALRKYHAQHLIPSSLDGLPQQQQLLEVKDLMFRPRSACSVILYNDVPLTPDTVTKRFGRQTKSSIMRSLVQCESAKTICSNDPWIKDKNRLCKIEYHHNGMEHGAKSYGSGKRRSRSSHGYFIGGRYTSPSVVDSSQVNRGGVCVSRDNLAVAYEMQPRRISELVSRTKGDRPSSESKTPIRSEKISMSSIGVNTEPHCLSMSNWHGADWQVKRPKLYGPPVMKYDPKISIPARSKMVTAEYMNMTAYALKVVGIT